MNSLRIHIQGDVDFLPEIKQFVGDLAEAIPIAVRGLIDESTPAGRIYKRSLMTARRTKALERLGLKNRGKTRSVVGQRFHRASAPGQPPAKDTGKFYRNIQVVSKGDFEKTIRFNTPYAGHIEAIRPFLDKAITRAIEAVK